MVKVSPCTKAIIEDWKGGCFPNVKIPAKKKKITKKQGNMAQIKNKIKF